MDLNDIRSLVTLFSFVLFVALAYWTWRPTRQRAHDDAAQLPFLGEAQDAELAAQLQAQRVNTGSQR